MIKKYRQLLLFCTVLLALFTSMLTFAETSKVNVNIGVISCLTGEFARIGTDAVDAIRLAQEEFIKENPQYNIKLVIEDDSFSIPKSLSAYNKIMSLDRIDTLIGVSSTVVSAIGPDVRKRGLPMVQVFLEAESKVDSIVQISFDMDKPEEEFGAHIRKLTKGQSVLIVPTNETWLRLANAFERGYGPGLRVEQVPVGEYDLRSLAVRVRSANPERIMIMMGAEQGPLMLKELLAILDSKVQFAFDANFLSGLQQYKDTILNLSRIENAPLLTLSGTENAGFRKRFKARFGREAGPWTEFSYDAFRVLMGSYDQDPKVWVSKMHDYQTKGVSGDFSFNAVGVRQATFEIKTVGDVLALGTSNPRINPDSRNVTS